jgi:hypothetical protein
MESVGIPRPPDERDDCLLALFSYELLRAALALLAQQET